MVEMRVTTLRKFTILVLLASWIHYTGMFYRCSVRNYLNIGQHGSGPLRLLGTLLSTTASDEKFLSTRAGEIPSRSRHTAIGRSADNATLTVEVRRSVA